jgi:hypothetical protein
MIGKEAIAHLPFTRQIFTNVQEWQKWKIHIVTSADIGKETMYRRFITSIIDFLEIETIDYINNFLRFLTQKTSTI